MLLLLALLFGIAAPNESHAQTCNVSNAITQATLAYDHHKDNGGGNLATATVSYRVLITLGGTLPAWTGNNISGPAPTTAISEAELRIFLTGQNDFWDGWNPVYTALNCLEAALPVITISGGTAVTEGTGAQFTVNASPPPGSNLTVNLNVSDAASSDFVDAGDEGVKTVVIQANDTSATHTVPTAADSTDEAVAHVTVMVTGGGVDDGYRVGRTSSATVTVIDDDPGSPGIVLSVLGTLRLLETGSTTYTVALNAEPTHDVTVSTGGNTFGIQDREADANAVNISPHLLTFTTTNWDDPQTVTVTGADQATRHANRGLFISHGISSSDTRYGNLRDVAFRVNVDDAPELEAWWDYDRANGSVPFLRRPNTVMSSPGLTPDRNMYPGYELTYVLRLSNRPADGETVTVTATVPSDKQNLIGLSLTGPSDPLDGPDYQTWATNLPGTLEVTFHDGSPAAGTGCSNWHGGSEFEYHDDNGRFHTVTGGRRSETWDNTADTPWKCWRKVWVVRKPASRGIANTCADITHTASGGGVRQVTVDTVRVHIFNADFTRARDCPKLTENTLSTAAAEAAPVTAPTEVISNLQVTAVDAASAKVTWDAVEHATSYDVSWSAESSDSLNASAGAESVTGTTATIQHDASVPMTLTVTVTPEYIDKNGVTQQLDALAGTATLAVGPSGQRLDSGGGTNGGNGGSIDSGDGAVDLPVPVSHWRFEYDAVDWVGSSHGTEKGGVAFEANEEGEGVEDHALSLDGSDDYVDLSTHVSDFPLGDSTRSVTGWFKADAGNQGQSFFAYGPNVAGKRFSIAADRTQVLVAVSGHAWGVNGLELKEGWHHIAVTYAGGDSDDILIYLDGELQSASTLVGSSKRLDTQTGPAAIGRNVGGTKYYTGLIDDVRLYDVALSAEHVRALFDEHPQTVLAEDNMEVCVSEELLADVETRIQNNNSERWTQVKNALTGKQNAITLAEVKEIYERRTQNGWSTEQWDPVIEAMECLEAGNQ